MLVFNAIHDQVEHLGVHLGGNVARVQSESRCLFLSEPYETYVQWRFGGEVDAATRNDGTIEAAREQLVGTANVEDRVRVNTYIANAEQLQPEFDLSDVMFWYESRDRRAV